MSLALQITSPATTNTHQCVCKAYAAYEKPDFTTTDASGDPRAVTAFSCLPACLKSVSFGEKETPVSGLRGVFRCLQEVPRKFSSTV